MANTTRAGLPYPPYNAPADVPGDILALATRLDTIIAMDDQGSLGSRPAAGVSGRYYTDTVSGLTYRDNGSAWIALNPVGVGDGPAGTPTLRSLGPGGLQATPGNDPRLSDQRVPVDNSVTSAKISALLKPSGGAGATTEALRAIGTGAGQVAPGLHAAQHLPGGTDPFTMDPRNLPDSYLNASRLAGVWSFTSRGELIYNKGYNVPITGGYNSVAGSWVFPSVGPVANLTRQFRLKAIVYGENLGGATGNITVRVAQNTALAAVQGSTGGSGQMMNASGWVTWNPTDADGFYLEALANMLGGSGYYWGIYYVALECRYIR